MFEVENICESVVVGLKRLSLKNKCNRFDSGAVMIDAWKGETFLVVQIEKNCLGISVIGDHPEFSSVPDEIFTTRKEFFNKLAQFLA